ncbi:MAG: hypothetical protein WCG31_09090, partial [Deltaproteobacteria bacterium]
ICFGFLNCCGILNHGRTPLFLDLVLPLTTPAYAGAAARVALKTIRRSVTSRIMGADPCNASASSQSSAMLNSNEMRQLFFRTLSPSGEIRKNCLMLIQYSNVHGNI